MADYTENYNLIKPSDDDFYSVSDFNENSDIVDASLKILADAVANGASKELVNEILANILSLSTKVGETANTGGTAAAGTVFAKLNKILTDYTTTRAGKLDNLDTTISSRAQASTALSNATWTNTRAGYLDYLANGTYGLSAIRTLLNTINTNSSSSVIKSIQRGIATSATGGNVTVTISAVNTAKAFVIANASVSNQAPMGASAYLTNSTTLTVYPSYGYSGSFVKDVAWQVIEFY